MKNKRIAVLICVMIFLLSGCTTPTFFPEEGDWYCEELQLQLSFGSCDNCYIIVDDEIIRCACGSDRGSDWLSVGCQEIGSEYYALGEEVFGGRFVRLEHDALIILDPQNNVEYTFVRVVDLVG